LETSVPHESAGAPVDRELLLLAAGGSVTLLLCSVVARVWALDLLGDLWVLEGVRTWGLVTGHRLAPAAGTVALAGLALDAALATGCPVGMWARWCCTAQVAAAALVAFPMLAALVVGLLNLIIFVAVIVLIVGGLLALLFGAAAG